MQFVQIFTICKAKKANLHKSQFVKRIIDVKLDRNILALIFNLIIFGKFSPLNYDISINCSN